MLMLVAMFVLFDLGPCFVHALCEFIILPVHVHELNHFWYSWMLKNVKTPQQNVRWLFRDGNDGQWGKIVQSVFSDSLLNREKLEEVRLITHGGVPADIPDQQRVADKVCMLTWSPALRTMEAYSPQ